MLNPLSLIDCRLWYDLKCPQFTLVDNQVDGTEFTIADFDTRIVVKELLRRCWNRFFDFFFFLWSLLARLLLGA